MKLLPALFLGILLCGSAGLSGCISGGSAQADGGPHFVPSDKQSDWSPSLRIGLGDPAHSGVAWPREFDVPPFAYDINGDGRSELVAQGNDTMVYVFDSDNGHILAKLATTIPPAWHIERVLNGAEVAVLHPGDPPSIVVTDHAAYVAVWRYVAAKSTADHFEFEKMWDHRMEKCHKSPSMDAKPTLADLDGDGSLEILVQTEEVGFYALHADGSIMWQQCWAGGNSAPTVADLNGDGHLKAIFGSDSGFISVIDGKSGKPDWTFDAHKQGITPASISTSPVVAELDGQYPKEVLFTTRVAPPGDLDSFHNDHMAIFAVHQNPATYQSELLWMRQPDWANPLSYTHLVVGDVDGDHRPDIFGMDWNTIGHNPGNWEVLGPAHVFRLDAEGNDVWVREVDAWWSNQDIALADLDGNGHFSVLANGPKGGYDGIFRLSADTGQAEGFLALDQWKETRGPQLMDLAGNGRMQLVFPVEPKDGGGRGAILVFDLGVAFSTPTLDP